MAALRKAAMALMIIILIAVAGLLSCILPQHRVVYVDGTEVRRGDTTVMTSNVTPVTSIGGADVYYLHTSNLKRTDVFVCRNEDTGFGFPWYFKFDSSEVQGRAELLKQQPEQMALVTYYGWRVPVLKLYPNAVNIEAWDRTETPWPVFNIVLVAFLLLVTGSVYWKLRGFRKARQLKRDASQSTIL